MAAPQAFLQLRQQLQVQHGAAGTQLQEHLIRLRDAGRVPHPLSMDTVDTVDPEGTHSISLKSWIHVLKLVDICGYIYIYTHKRCVMLSFKPSISPAFGVIALTPYWPISYIPMYVILHV